MKEERFFYVPGAAETDRLPDGEAAHAIRVLRMRAGDTMTLIDGKGTFYNASVTRVDGKRCFYEITASTPWTREWNGACHIAVAPTKMTERIEWMAEKCTEIGVDTLSFLNCAHSERHDIKTDRLERIAAAAAKQSRKAVIPTINDMLPFDRFIATHTRGPRFIAHCHSDLPRASLLDELAQRTDPAAEKTVLIGPEGDFSEDEVKAALDNGFIPVHLGKSRLRTETAALYALMMMHVCCPR